MFLLSQLLPPSLETPRLMLRRWRLRDLGPHTEMSADPTVMRFIGSGHPLGRCGGVLDIAMHAGRWTVRGYGHWALERKADGASIGRAGLWPPKEFPGLEMGWKLAPEAWGQGYATEAAQTVIDWAWRSLNPPLLTAVIHRENTASIRVAQRIGMHFISNSTFKGQPTFIYGTTRPRPHPRRQATR